MSRPKGSKNKMPRETRAYVLAVVEKLEAQGKGLYQWALKNENDFWGKVFKAVVPREVDANLSGDLKIEVLTGIERAPNQD